jgi:hypothetical protein
MANVWSRFFKNATGEGEPCMEVGSASGGIALVNEPGGCVDAPTLQCPVVDNTQLTEKRRILTAQPACERSDRPR